MNDSDPAPRLPQPNGSGRVCEIRLQNPCGYREAGARRLRPWLSGLVSDLAPSAGGLGVRFVSDREMRRISREFRHKDRTTDVLSFVGDYPPSADRGFAPPVEELGADVGFVPSLPDDDPSGSDGPYLGDIVISVPEARRQAQELGHGVDVELRALLLHGLLHCLGYDHEADDGTMERLERRLRTAYAAAGGAAS